MPQCRPRPRRTTTPRRSSGLWLGQLQRGRLRNMVGLLRQFELHLVHLELLRDWHGVRAVEARAAELLGGTTSYGAHEARGGEVRKAVRAEVLAYFIDGSAGCDQLFGG